MTASTLKDVLDPAFEQRYAVPAFNVVDALSLESVVAAAEELASPVIVQTSLKTVKAIGPEILHAYFRAAADQARVPVVLHLDHCPDREWVSKCLATGWGSVLFDGSHLDVEENFRQTAEVVREARDYGAHIEGELEAVRGVEDGVGSDSEADVHPIELSDRFIAETGVYCFAPALGTAHGLYTKAPKLMPERASQLLARRPVPLVLHGGTGLTEDQFRDLIARGCAKINISTALKIAYIGAHREFLDANPLKQDPLELHANVRAAVKDVARAHIYLFGSAGQVGQAGS